MAILVSFLNLLLYIAIILLISYIILWVVRDWFSIAIDANVMKFAQIVVGLICPDCNRGLARWRARRWHRVAALLS